MTDTEPDTERDTEPDTERDTEPDATPVGGSQEHARPALRCEGLTRRFGDRTAVDGVTFEIAPGETYGLLGPNGAGKTTTIRMVCGLLHPDAGRITVGAHEIGRHDVQVRADIGYVPQDLALYPDLSARENLQFFGRLYRLRGRLLKERIDEVLALVELSERADDRVEAFSGGMRRRLNIGAALLHRPALLVLDEPTVGVDPQSRHAILTSIERFGASGMAILYTTHYMEEADRICNRVGIMDRGRLVAQGTRRELVTFVAERDRVELTASGDLRALRDACRADGRDRRGDGRRRRAAPPRRRRSQAAPAGARRGRARRRFRQQRGGRRTRPRSGVPASHRHGSAGLNDVGGVDDRAQGPAPAVS